jgi:hypothetical protein
VLGIAHRRSVPRAQVTSAAQTDNEVRSLHPFSVIERILAGSWGVLEKDPLCLAKIRGTELVWQLL